MSKQCIASLVYLRGSDYMGELVLLITILESSTLATHFTMEIPR